MRFSLLLMAVALVGAACSASSAATTSSVSIDSADVSGSHVSVVVTVGGDDAMLLSVAWGDGTSEPEVRGTGRFAHEHTYGADVVSATISATATAPDGSVASDIAVVELSNGATTTSVVALATTTTAAVSTTTTSTTTVPPTTTEPSTTTTSSTTTTTTTQPPTTTTTQPPTTTTSSTTTTTTIPLPAAAEIELNISAGVIFDRWGGGINESTWNGKTATATVTRHKDTWESDGLAVAFAIPASSYEELKSGAESLLFEFIAYPLANYRLETDLSDGNAAEVKWEFMGTYDTTWSGSAKVVDVGAGFLTQGKSGEPMEASWLLDKRDFGIPQTVYVFFQCRAKGPGGILVTSDSKCDASLDVNGIVVTVTANR
ncbi:MAG: hypothetical protein U9N78_03495 [Actinomycetota bacterium]|nr:hypothetical protein [Actinomycetota bacterium]